MRVSEIEIITPASVPECLSYLSNTKNKVRLIAGGYAGKERDICLCI